jgi:hypothetical protein
VREKYPELRLCGERFFPMLLNAGSGISVSCPKHQPLKRNYVNQPLAFEATVFAKSSLIHVESDRGGVDVQMNLMLPPEKPHTPIVEITTADATTIRIPASSSRIIGGFETVFYLEVRYLPLNRKDTDNGTKVRIYITVLYNL